MKKKLTRTLKLLWNRLPHPLPSTGVEFDALVTDIFETYGFRDDKTYREYLAGVIMHLDHRVVKLSKYYFALMLTRQIANRVAYGKLEQYKQEAKEAAQAKTVSHSNGFQGFQESSGQVVS